MAPHNNGLADHHEPLLQRIHASIVLNATDIRSFLNKGIHTPGNTSPQYEVDNPFTALESASKRSFHRHLAYTALGISVGVPAFLFGSSAVMLLGIVAIGVPTAIALSDYGDF